MSGFPHLAEAALRGTLQGQLPAERIEHRRAVAPPLAKERRLKIVLAREGKQRGESLHSWNPGRARFQRPSTAAKGTHGEPPEMTMKNRCSGRISTIHNAAIRFAIGVIVAIIASHAAQVPALAQTSDANSPPPSSK